MGKYFGTDGIRGVVNKTLDAELAYQVGRAAVTMLAEHGVSRPVVTIGKDTRISSDMLEAALSAGICSAGRRCHAAGRSADTGSRIHNSPDEGGSWNRDFGLSQPL